MDLAVIAFNAIYESLVDARCQVRIDRKIITRALCAGMVVNRQNTDEGQFGGIDANVRFPTSDESDGEIKNGTVIEILQNGKDEKTGWFKARVGGRVSIAGVTRLILEAVNE